MSREPGLQEELSFSFNGISITETHRKRFLRPPTQSDVDDALAWIAAERADEEYIYYLKFELDQPGVAGEVVRRIKSLGVDRNLKAALAWMALRSGQAALSDAIALLSDAPAWDSDQRIGASLDQLRSGEFVTHVTVTDPNGIDVNPTREERTVAPTVKDALVQIADDIGATQLGVDIAAL